MASNPVSSFELSKALDALILQEIIPNLELSDITAPRVSEKAKCHHQRAMSMIKRWESEGRIEYIGVRRDENGHKSKAWRMKA